MKEIQLVQQEIEHLQQLLQHPQPLADQQKIQAMIKSAKAYLELLKTVKHDS
jgi:3-methyladenine DNA glycosylase Tag